MPAAHDDTNRGAFGVWLVKQRGTRTIAEAATALRCDRGTLEQHELGYRTPTGRLKQPSARLRTAIERVYGAIPPDVDPRGAPMPLEARVANLEAQVRAIGTRLAVLAPEAAAEGVAEALDAAASQSGRPPGRQRRTRPR